MREKTIKTIKNIIVVLIALFISTMPVSAQENTKDKANKIDELMNLYYEYGQFNGSVLVAENGEMIYKKGLGFANMEWNILNQSNTKFRIASLTKQFTSMLIMQLIEEEKIDLDNKIIKYLPEYRIDIGDKVTIHHLLTHTSGIPNYTNIPGFWTDSTRNYYSLDFMLKNFCSNDLRFEPGTKIEYNNSGYFLLGLIIERVTGYQFKNVLHEKILKPLGMNNTGIDHHEIILKNRAVGYREHINGYTNAPYNCMHNFYASGDMYSTVEDLYLWDQALYSDKLLSKEYRDIMFKPYLNNYAYGWGVKKIQIGATRDSILIISHSGGLAGINTRIYRIIDDKHLIVLLNNFSGNHKISEITREITNILYDLPYEFPKNSIAKVLLKTIEEKDIESAVKQYHEIKLQSLESFNFDEEELNSLGYYLLEKRKNKEAIRIFKLNVLIFPNSSNAYDSLGEAYMKNGNNENAIKNYRKSLELNTENTNAKEILEKLEKRNF